MDIRFLRKLTHTQALHVLDLSIGLSVIGLSNDFKPGASS